MRHDWRGCHLSPYSQHYDPKAGQAFFENKANSPDVWHRDVFKSTSRQCYLPRVPRYSQAHSFQEAFSVYCHVLLRLPDESKHRQPLIGRRLQHKAVHATGAVQYCILHNMHHHGMHVSVAPRFWVLLQEAFNKTTTASFTPREPMKIVFTLDDNKKNYGYGCARNIKFGCESGLKRVRHIKTPRRDTTTTPCATPSQTFHWCHFLSMKIM